MRLVIRALLAQPELQVFKVLQDQLERLEFKARLAQPELLEFRE